MTLLSSHVSALPPLATSSQFSSKEAVLSNSGGLNVIRGRAILSRGSLARTCAGSDVNLIPDSSEARKLMRRMFGSLNQGLLKTVAGADAGARYALAWKTARCDGQGYFAFTDVPQGTYYVTANIFWASHSQLPANWSGGDLMQRVEVTGDQTKDILLWLDTKGRSPRAKRRMTEIL